MGRFQAHLRNKMVAGLLAAIPVAVTMFILWYVDSKARGSAAVRDAVRRDRASRWCSSTCWASSSPASSASSCCTCSTASSGASRGCAISTARGSRWRWPTRRSGSSRTSCWCRTKRAEARPRLHQRARDRRRSRDCLRLRARLAQPDLRQALLRADHPLHSPGDEPAGRAQADDLGRKLRARFASARGRSAGIRCPASGSAARRRPRVSGS